MYYLFSWRQNGDHGKFDGDCFLCVILVMSENKNNLFKENKDTKKCL